MSFTAPLFLLVFVPCLSAVYFPLRELEGRHAARAPRVFGASAWALLAASVVFVGLSLAQAVGAGAFAAALPFAALGAAIVACHAVAYAEDVRKGHTDKGHPLQVALYLLQFPVLPAGPILRFRDFRAQLARRVVSMGSFAYGVRRLVTGLVKAGLIADVLGRTTDKILALPAAELGFGVAWLAAVCAPLETYFLFSGYADMAMGLGRMLGFRYPENFRRPFTADSIREFWRRWNVTLLTWLRDYLSLPIAGQDPPAPRLYLNIILGFCLVGLWHGAGWNAPIWGLYFGTLLGLEAVGIGAKLSRLPAALRHAYVLVAVGVGWVILRTPTASEAAIVLRAMAGLGGGAGMSAVELLTPQLQMTLIVAMVGAGPLISSISRWRVSVDAATTSMLMMLAATGVFVWRPVALMARSVWPAER